MKIALFEIRDDEKMVLMDQLKKYDCQYFSETLTVAHLPKIADIEALVVFVGSEVRKNIIDGLPQLKFIATRSTGFDHIDVTYAKEKGIIVSTVPAYGTHTVAEFTFALILALSRKIVEAIQVVRKDKHFSLADLKGFDLFGKTIGVIGTGKIGKNVAIIAKAFGMKVLITDAYPDQAFAKEQGLTYMGVDELLKVSDIVTLHLPYNKETYHFINSKNIQRIKKGAYIINTARGELLETKALLEALQSGHLAGAALDVLEMERKLTTVDTTKDMAVVSEDKQLMDMPNVLITPHVAFFTTEAEMAIIMNTVANINGFAQGAPVNVVSVS